MINSEIERTLINIANIHSGLLQDKFVSSKDQFFNFKSLGTGIPITIPNNPEILEGSEIFSLSRSDHKQLIYGKIKSDYIGFAQLPAGQIFLKNIRVRSKYKSFLREVLDEIFHVRETVLSLKERFGTVGAFQTRNLPHYGHEKIIENLLEKVEVVVINPLVGPKKKGDLKVEKFEGLYDNVLKQRFGNRLFFLPLKANMFYAGPREAIHHIQMRQWLGFTHFSVGRDHAGAENVYEPGEAISIVEKYRESFQISVLTHKGAVFCTKCNKIIIKSDCSHNKSSFEEISGSSLRSSLRTGMNYRFVSPDVESWARLKIDDLTF